MSLGETELHAWRTGPDQFPAESFASELSLEEAARRFCRAGDRRRYRAAHGALRRILSRYCGITPAALRFGRTLKCKPYLEPPLPEGWLVKELEPGAGYAATVAAERTPARLLTWEYAD
ncbi:MAG TPA: hypothetical protein PLA43_05395 [Bryobacteraceae bacterium]|nr:hypothetical protein [Bryobacteraceae bacterium]HPU71370.1 hypothetical protein [Bryobacteraceae bacterium]